MLGLKTQENEKFRNFWKKVQLEASKQQSIFFLNCGEGKNFETDTMEGEDLSGWLIPKDKANLFEKEWLKNKVSDKWVDNMFWVEWKKINDEIFIELKTY